MLSVILLTALFDWVIKGYTSSPKLTPEKESFDVSLSSLRVGVEMAFGKPESLHDFLRSKTMGSI